MQGVISREYEVAECYFDNFSITVVLGRDDPDCKAGAAIRCTAQPLLINGVKRILHRAPAYNVIFSLQQIILNSRVGIYM